jgi:hypothetical protein
MEFTAVVNCHFSVMDILLADLSEIKISSINPVIQIQTLLQKHKHPNDCYLFISSHAAQLTQSLLQFSICHHFPLLILDLVV